eukprot:Phypoly_transcript_06363.p1 GENE.Phypoly_transcript_06363~~Phypoly_transcript_06363.p1  ORF type:complete len:506 (+),score=147.03 Phypoly_transcript_06363:177-1694(+)
MDVRDFDPKSSYWSNKYASLLKDSGKSSYAQSDVANVTQRTSQLHLDSMDGAGARGDAQSEARARKEQDLRIRAEQEQARLIGVNHELTLQLERLKTEGESELRETKAKVVELEFKLAAMQDVHETGEMSLGKYRMRAEQVMRELEASQADQERSRRRAEEALARTVAAAHAKLTAKQEALDAAEASRAEEAALRMRLQSQLETFVAQRAAAMQQLDSQLAASKARELELSTKLTEANQRAEEVTRRQALSEANTLSVQALLSGVGGGGEKTKEKDAEREEWERSKRAAAQREAELCARLAEQNHIIRLLRQTLASSSPSPGSILSSASPIPPSSSNFGDTKFFELQSKTEMLQQALEEKENKLKYAVSELEEANKRIQKSEDQRLMQAQRTSESSAPPNTDEKRKIEELTSKNVSLTEEKKKLEEEIAFKTREIQALKEQVGQMQKELEVKASLAASAQVMQAEMDESHINEIKLLEQVEQGRKLNLGLVLRVYSYATPWLVAV